MPRSNLALIASASIAFVLIGVALNPSTSHKSTHQKAFKVLVPFVFSESIDPLNIVTVGDQILSEHIFAFHAKATFENGYEGVVSELDFSRPNTVTIKPRLDLKTADDKPISFDAICDSLRVSSKGSRHANYSPLLKEIRCNSAESEIEISYSTMPVNLRMLFTLPDYAIADRRDLPVKPGSLKTSGPYILSSLSTESASLLPNENFPEDLVSNRLPVIISRYAAGDSKHIIESLKSNDVDAAYFFGQALGKEDASNAREQGYKVETHPAEWLIYLSLNSKVPQDVRTELRLEVRDFQASSDFQNSLGQPAYSLSPSDQPFGLSAQDVPIPETLQLSTHRTTSLRLGTLDTWIKQELFDSFLKRLRTKMPNIAIEILPANEIGRLFKEEFDIVLSPLGMSPTDPLSHLHFLSDMNPTLADSFGRAELLAASTITDEEAFSAAVRNIEKQPVMSGLLIPIGHFPGVVVRKSEIDINHKQTFGWGIQTWSFRVN